MTEKRLNNFLKSPESLVIPEDITPTSAEQKPRNQLHEDLKQLTKEVHSISQELKKLNSKI